ncbi:MAG: hypothetical protein ACJ8AW_10090 [Rhodopila sp.]
MPGQASSRCSSTAACTASRDPGGERQPVARHLAVYALLRTRDIPHRLTSIAPAQRLSDPLYAGRIVAF